MTRWRRRSRHSHLDHLARALAAALLGGAERTGGDSAPARLLGQGTTPSRLTAPPAPGQYRRQGSMVNEQALVSALVAYVVPSAVMIHRSHDSLVGWLWPLLCMAPTSYIGLSIFGAAYDKPISCTNFCASAITFA